MEPQIENDTQRSPCPLSCLQVKLHQMLHVICLKEFFFYTVIYQHVFFFFHHPLDVEYYEGSKNGFYWVKEAVDFNYHNIGLENDKFHKRGVNEML